MTTLEWTLFAIIDLLILLLIPCLGAIYIFGNAISAVLPRIPRKSLWRTIVDKLRQFAGRLQDA